MKGQLYLCLNGKDEQRDRSLQGENLKRVEIFKYVGPNVADDSELEAEINQDIGREKKLEKYVRCVM